MIRALFSAATGVEAQQLRVDIIANNLANVNTTGFKRVRGDFQDLLYQTERAVGTASSSDTQVPTGIQVGQGTRPVATQKLFSQGDFMQTKNELDLAIEGRGFFQILQPGGDVAYSRSGAFKRDSQGRIVNSDGYLLQPELTIPGDAVQVAIGPDGTVSVIQAGQISPTEIGKITLVSFLNPAGLLSLGRNLYKQSEASGQPVNGTPGNNGLGTVAQGFLENSNVNIAEELVSMISAQRAYELNARVIRVADEMLQYSNRT
ncbi:MAG: flagellar basal-body rod protein FlgG [Candidatus Tectomicrobia bacterium]|nr:flagellar basal-body rod protein FlgG [Candidatus Tectomicrobia bacterium]